LLSYNGSLGDNSGSIGTATVSGTGSMWTNRYNLYVGRWGSGTLNIEAGGQVSASNGILGCDSGSTGTATVTGTGSTWTNSGELYVGREGSGTLTATDGGAVTAETLYASVGDLFGNGTITATGGAVLDADLIFDATHGSQQTFAFGTGGTLNVNWDGNGALGAGHKGAGTLRIADGVTVASAKGYLGYFSGSTGAATVSGTGSMWTNSGKLYVGHRGSGTLNIEANGQVSSRYGELGDNSGSIGTATVSGTGSTWTNKHNLYVGRGGSGTLNIEAGGQVSNTLAYLGYLSHSTGTATVSGTGSMWTNSGNLYVSRWGSGTLTVTDGGAVTAETLYASVGDLFGNGTITATGGAVLDADLIFDATHGSQQTLAFGTGGSLNVNWDGTGALGAGHKGAGTLRIADGVTVASSYGDLGYVIGSTGTATVTGTGSKWTNSGWLFVGNEGSGTLNIEAGGQVSNTLTYLGYHIGSNGTATVTGTGSKWTNSGELYVGHEGGGTLNITDCGLVSVAGTLTIEYQPSAGPCFINMSTDGMLALFGDADDSLNDYLGLVQGSDAIRWWDDSMDDWALLTTATPDTDYTLEYLTAGDLGGYTLLTVGIVPEPGALALLMTAAMGLWIYTRLKRR
jgi:T5SS/PEP-CTERM-associated repeat protein